MSGRIFGLFELIGRRSPSKPGRTKLDAGQSVNIYADLIGAPSWIIQLDDGKRRPSSPTPIGCSPDNGPKLGDSDAPSPDL